MQKYNVLDLFCGCGGMSWGLKKKNFNIVAGIDNWEPALNTYAYNHGGTKALNLDLSRVEPSEVLRAIGKRKNEIDVIVGGPPCQGFSKNIPAYGRFLEDPRNQLYRAYLRFVHEIRPKVAILENVAEIYNAFGGIVRREIIENLEADGYQVEVQIVNMSEYGIPQKRRRCFFLHPDLAVLCFRTSRKIWYLLGRQFQISRLSIREKGMMVCRIPLNAKMITRNI